MQPTSDKEAPKPLRTSPPGSTERPPWRRVLGWTALTLLALAAVRLVVDALLRIGVGRMPVDRVGTIASAVGWVLLLAVFAWLGTRVVRDRWWEGAAAGALAVLALHLALPLGRFVLALLRSEDRLMMARLVTRG